MKNFLKFNNRELKADEPRISYSQFAMYSKCPKQWELSYVQNLRTNRQSIHTIFGTAFHETLQHYLTVLYEDSIKSSEYINLHETLKDKMHSLYKEAFEVTNVHFSNKEELEEFYNDGCLILDWIKKKRGVLFSKRTEELVGIEIPICHPVFKGSNVLLVGFLDVVLFDKALNKITIIDIKTSTSGWNKYQKADKLKTSQLVLYKTYFAEQYGYDVDKIDIVYMIVKRKLIENALFPQKRLTEFSPASGKPTRNVLLNELKTFTTTCFMPDGSYNKDHNYLSIAGKNYKNCTYCEFAEDDELCPLKNRIKQ